MGKILDEIKQNHITAVGPRAKGHDENLAPLTLHNKEFYNLLQRFDLESNPERS